MIGTTISHYRILEKLGEGGMGIVYKAEDLKLKRIVAIKFLSPHLSTSEDVKNRFIQEAQAASALSHPNVCTIFDIQEHDDQMFIIMEFVDGETLKGRKGKSSIREAVDIAIQIADGLAAAHEKGIVHRDIKPENIMLRKDGLVQILDFGLAKIAGEVSRLTKEGSTVGTAGYMSPEQVRGLEADTRSDIFSYGVLLYELCTGELPFRGVHETALAYEIVNVDPKPMSAINTEIDVSLDTIVSECLEKDPAQRTQSAKQIAVDLRRLKRGSEIQRAQKPVVVTPMEQVKTRRPGNMILIGGAVVLFIVVAAGIYFMKVRGNAIESLAVLPFENVGTDSTMEYLGDGITESLINSLSQVPKLKVLSRSLVFRYKGKEIDPRKVGNDLGVKAVLTGRVIPRGENLTISVELVDASDNSTIWGDQYERKLSDILSVQRDVTRDISEKLRLKLTSEERNLIGKEHTMNPEAYQAYLKGLFWWNKRTEDGFTKGVEYFNQAIERDPNYALAYSGLANCYALLVRWSAIAPRDEQPKAKAAAMKAMELDDQLGEAHTSLAWVLWDDYDWNGAEKEFKRALELSPNYATGHHWYATYLMEMGRTEEALAQITRAEELEPLSVAIITDLARALLYAKRYDEAIAACRRALEVDPNFWRGHYYTGLAFAGQGKFEEAIVQLKKARELDENMWVLRGLGYVLAVSGKKNDARAILSRLTELSKKRYVDPFAFAIIYAGLRENDEVFAWLEKAYSERSNWLSSIITEPQLDGVRSDPRFNALAKKLNLER